MKMILVENHGVRCMSIGFLVDKDAPIVWRGPMVCFCMCFCYISFEFSIYIGHFIKSIFFIFAFLDVW
jgi:hypothetical protein